jgi:hypothetical protein
MTILKPVAEKVCEPINVYVDVPKDRFWIRDDFGDDIQVRIDPGEKVYLCYTSQNRRNIVSREIPWHEFKILFRAFVDSIEMKED